MKYCVVFFFFATGGIQAQKMACTQAELPSKQLSIWMNQAHARNQNDELLCYLRSQATNYKALAVQEHAVLLDAYEHPIGNTKYPSAADRARVLESHYREKLERYERLIKTVEMRKVEDAPVF